MTFLLTLFVGLAHAFVPPLSGLAKEALEGRRSAPFTEVVFRHHIEVRSGESVDLEELWFTGSQGLVTLFKVPGGATVGAANLDRKTYIFPGAFKVGSSSGLFVKYFLTASADDLLTALINEKFVRREHLNQFKQGFEPKGDPQSWDVKEFYNVQEGVSLKRVKSQPAFAFSGGGSDESNHSVFFSKEGPGISRLEWKVGNEVVGWNFEGHTRFQSAGTYPKRLEFEKNGQTLVTSEVLVHRPTKEKQYTEMKKNARTIPAPSGQTEEALRILLSFR